MWRKNPKCPLQVSSNMKTTSLTQFLISAGYDASTCAFSTCYDAASLNGSTHGRSRSIQRSLAWGIRLSFPSAFAGHLKSSARWAFLVASQ
jgi:hypothetical protein